MYLLFLVLLWLNVLFGAIDLAEALLKPCWRALNVACPRSPRVYARHAHCLQKDIDKLHMTQTNKIIMKNRATLVHAYRYLMKRSHLVCSTCIGESTFGDAVIFYCFLLFVSYISVNSKRVIWVLKKETDSVSSIYHQCTLVCSWLWLWLIATWILSDSVITYPTKFPG